MEQGYFSEADQVAELQRPLILAVDDSADDLVLITQALTLFGYAFITATDGPTALQLAQTYQPDLILLDIVLRGMSGIEVSRELKQRSQTQQIPVIAVTVLARAEDRTQILGAGCNDYINKPYRLEDLEMMLQQYLS
ncbi:MAG TPA: response regulator [Candidatus Obscuribacterales bacterium]